MPISHSKKLKKIKLERVSYGDIVDEVFLSPCSAAESRVFNDPLGVFGFIIHFDRESQIISNDEVIKVQSQAQARSDCRLLTIWQS